MGSDCKFLKIYNGLAVSPSGIIKNATVLVRSGIIETVSEGNLKVFQKAIADFGKPEIVNSDQGSQCTCEGWAEYLTKQGIIISVDGKGRCLDNIWIERLWRTIKQEYIYLNPAGDCKVLFKGLRKFLDYCSHRSLDRRTPFDWYECAA
ncbi:MAG: hypothetical protein NTZ69_00705 [Bacteroidia bacterium]|nr:hypothetical protein [Bacteroidia bacterium]